jgi:hypothetical protein
MVTGVNQSLAELARELRLDRPVFLLREITPANSTLVCDDDQFVPLLFQPPQRFRRLREDFDFLRIATIIDIPHQRSVPVEENSRPALVRRAGHFGNWR